MSPLDSAFLRIEAPGVSMHIASMAIFDGPAPDQAAITDAVQTKLSAVPRYRQRVREIPLRLGRPVWVDDDTFDLGYHLRRTALPRPGDVAALSELVGRLMSQPLRRDRPLWEMWVVEGLANERWAVISKVHHCMVDGIAGTGLMEVVFDHAPDVARPGVEEWTPHPPPSRARLVASALTTFPGRPSSLLARAQAGVRHPRRSALSVGLRIRGLADFAQLARPHQRSTLAGDLAPTRQWQPTQIAIANVRTIRGAFGGTLNDVVVAAVTRGFRDLLLARHEGVDQRSVRALVPVSVRANGGAGRSANEVSAIVAELPVHVQKTIDRLAAVRAELDRLKRSGEAQAGELITGAAYLIPGPILALGLGGLFRIPQPFVTTVVTNVPGPRAPLYFAGRRMCALYPYVPIADRLRIGVAIESYCDVLYVGVTADRDHAPDIGVLVAGIDAEIAELLRLALTAESAA